MSGCSIDEKEVKKIKADIGAIKIQVKGSGNPSDLVPRIKEYIASIQNEKRYNRDDRDIFALTIANITAPFKGSSDFLGNFGNIKKYINNVALGILSSNESETNNKIETEQEATARKDLSIDFLRKAFGDALTLRNLVDIEFTRNIVDAFIINRAEGKVIGNSAELNSYVRDYKQKLLNDITSYLDSCRDDEVNTIRKDIANLKMFSLGRYTGVLETIKPEILQYILNEIEGKDSNNLINKSDKLKKAYSAYVILSNFDSYVDYKFGKSIQISRPGVHAWTKYRFSTKNEQIGASFQFNEDINAEKEVSNIVKLILSTTKRYDWQSHYPSENKFITFNRFSNLIGKLKLGIFADSVVDCVFDRNFEETDIWDQLTENTKKILRPDNLVKQGKSLSLSQLISLAKGNTLKYLSAIFEVLCNQEFYETHKSVYRSKGLNIDNAQELSILYSLYKGVFDPRNQESLLWITRRNLDKHNYYSDITAIVNSIYKISHVQYYEDSDGEIRLRTLVDRGMDDVKRKLEQKINIDLSVKQNPNFDPEVTLVLKTPNLYKVNIEIKTLSGKPIIAEVSSTERSKVKFRIENSQIQITDKYWNDPNLIKFLDKYLRLDLTKNYDLKEALRSSHKENLKLNNLVLFACKVALNRYINCDLSKELGNQFFGSLETKASKIFGTQKIDKNLGQINVIKNDDIDLLYALSEEQAALTDRMFSSTVRDSEGKGISQEGLNRLFECYTSQVELLERADDSALKDLSIINSKLIKGVSAVREIKTNTTTKKTISMTPAEKMITAIKYDYIYGLLTGEDIKSTDVLGNRIIGLTPSVFSDKPLDGRLIVDLNQEINGIHLYKASFEDLLTIFPKELAKTYSVIRQNINEDLYNLVLFIRSRNQNFNNNFIQEGFENLKDLYTDKFFDFLNRNSFEDTAKYLNQEIDLYNKQPGVKKISLIDLIHFVENKIILKDGTKKSGIFTNKALLAQISRFSSIEKTKEWFEEKNLEILKSMLQSNAVIDVSSDSKIDTKLRGDKDLKEWIDRAKNLVIAKVKLPGDAKETNISTKTDLDKILIKLGLSSLNTNDAVNKLSEYGLIINPLLQKLNALDYFVTLEFMLTTVGTFAAHKIKENGLEISQEESLRQIALDKRNNDFSASTHAFELNKVDGIPTKYNIAVIEDFAAYLYSITLSAKTKPFDGSTIVNPFIVYLENNSLGPLKVGITKKQFVHFYNARYATGGDIKTAGFGMTNDLIRRSRFMQVAMKKMTDIAWGVPVKSILKDYNGHDILYFTDDDGNPKDLYFKEKGKYYQIVNIRQTENGNYVRSVVEVNKSGVWQQNEATELPEVSINSNYQLWKFFGGENSCELNSDGELEWSEQSIKNVVKAIIGVGTKKEGILSVETAEDVDLPLKHSDVHYLCNEGSIKYGMANKNYVDSMDMNNLDAVVNQAPYNTFEINMYDAGIQLDKEHVADDSELSLMTQVISACASNGFTFDRAANVYKAIALMSEMNTDNIRQVVESNQDLRLIITELLTKSTINSNGKESFLNIFTDKLANKVNSNKGLTEEDDIIPISDSSIFSKALSNLAVYLTKQGIRLKVPGTLSVISPGFGVMRLHANRMLDDFDDFETEIALLQEEANKTPIFKKEYSEDGSYQTLGSLSNIELGRYYIIDRAIPITNEQGETTIQIQQSIEYIGDPTKYNEIKHDSSIVKIVESLKEGRELGTYNVRFEGIDEETGIRLSFLLWDLDSIQYLYSGDKSYKVKALNDLKTISPNYKGVDKSNIVIIDGKRVRVDLKTVKTLNYEVIMPKVFATKFGLGKYDSVAKIKQDPYFFTKKLVKHLNVNVNDDLYQIALIKKSGNSTLLASKNSINTSRLQKLSLITTDEKGAYLYDIDGNVRKRLSSINDEVYLDPDTNNIIVLTDNLNYYVENEHYSDINISKAVKDKEYVLNIIRESDNKTAKNWIESVGDNLDSLYDFGNVNWQDKKQIDNLINTNSRFRYIVRQGAEIYNSWLRSLNIIAARIPCQSQQSFMGMDVVAYENEDVNNAYVSAMLLWLQGSDLDIDAVSLQTYDINSEGLLELWSPYANLLDVPGSLELPFPSGKKTIIVDDSTINPEEEVLKLISFFSSKTLKTYIDKDNNLKLKVSALSDLSEVKRFLETYSDIMYKPKTNEQIKLFVSALNNAGIAVKLENFDSFMSQLENIINKHNLFLKSKKVNQDRQEMMLNNHMIYNELEVIQDPVNLFQAQSSVDDTTKELKDVGNSSEKGQATKQKSPGNFNNKSERLYDTQTGKACVGVCAVGLKTFFAITLYINNILRNGTLSQQEKLKFDAKTFKFIFKDEKGNIIKDPDGNNEHVRSFSKIANVKPDSLDTVKVEEIKESLLSLSRLDELNLTDFEKLANENDAALILSAFLSLATDNAKELLLSKLNANVRTIGMYVYGLSLGMTFKEISNIMLSPFMNMAIELTEGNLFDNDEGYRNFYMLFDYFEDGPVEQMAKFSQENRLYNLINKKYYANRTNKLYGISNLVTFAQSTEIELEDKIAVLDEFRDVLAKSSKNLANTNKMIDFAQKYCILYNSINVNRIYYDDVKLLAYGAEEFRVLGSILKLNQGLPTSPDEIVDRVNKIETVLYKQAKRAGKKKNIPNKFDLFEFAFNEEYRQSQIDLYDTVKDTINILDVINSNPHYLAYLQALALLHKCGMVGSSRYRSIYNILYSDELKSTGIYNEKMSKKISEFIGDLTIKNWLFSKQIVFRLPKFSYVKDEKTCQTTEGLKIILGTTEGNFLFRTWMNLVVFPGLQNDLINENLTSNKFIQALTPTVFTNTFDGNPIVAWTVNSTTLPSNEFELQQFDIIKTDFNELLRNNYKYDGHNIFELIYYYNLVTYSNKLGTLTFTKLFEDKLNLGIIEDFHNFELNLDKSGECYNVGDFDLEELITYIAPYGSVFASNKNYIIQKDKDTGLNVLYKKREKRKPNEEVDNLDLEEEGGGKYKKYKSRKPEVDFTKDKFVIIYNGDHGSVKISDIDKDGFAKSILVKGKNITLTSNENQIGELILQIRDGELVYDEKEIDNLIDTKLNCG